MKAQRNQKLLFSSILKEVLKYLDVQNNAVYQRDILNICGSYLHIFEIFERSKRISEKDCTEIMVRTGKVIDVKPNVTDESASYLTKKERKSIYLKIFEEFNKALSKIIDDNLEEIQDRYSSDYKHLRQTFMSYSYKDKGLTLILFFYFLIHGGYLYIDWMHSPAYPNGIAIKDSLSHALRTSDQLLFLYTPNSEIKTDGNTRTFKEWCSWEFGSFYARSHQSKFYLRLPNNYSEYSIPDILDTFMEMDRVDYGKIYGHHRVINKLYVPNEDELVRVILSLFSQYVSKSYFDFEYIDPHTSSKIAYDAYNPRTKTALEFKLLLDRPKTSAPVDKKFLFGSDKGSHDITGKYIYARLRGLLNNAILSVGRYSDDVELIMVLPTRYSNCIAADEENRLLDEANNNRLPNLKKVFLVFIDEIHQFVLGEKKYIKTIKYSEEDI